MKVPRDARDSSVVTLERAELAFDERARTRSVDEQDVGCLRSLFLQYVRATATIFSLPIRCDMREDQDTRNSSKVFVRNALR